MTGVLNAAGQEVPVRLHIGVGELPVDEVDQKRILDEKPRRPAKLAVRHKPRWYPCPVCTGLVERYEVFQYRAPEEDYPSSSTQRAIS